MTRLRRQALPWLLLLTLVGGFVGASAAQESEPQPAPAEEGEQDEVMPELELEELQGEDLEGEDFEGEDLEGEEPLFFDDGPPDEDLDRIDDLLEEDALVLDTGFIYDAQGRRDPFRSLLRVAEVPAAGPRPPGVPGFDIDDITVTGIYVTQDGPVAQIRAAGDVKSYLIRSGDELYDGEVVRVEYVRGGGGEVVFRQEEKDPAAPKPYREVVKRLQP